MRPVRTSTAGARLGVPAVVPSPSSTLGVRDIQPGQCEGARAFESGVEPGHRFVGRLQPSRRAIHARDGRADPGRIGLEREPEAASHELAAGAGHRHPIDSSDSSAGPPCGRSPP